MATDSRAQSVVIDGPPGTQESVSLAGGSQPNPWQITGSLTVGSSQSGRLEIGAGGRVESNASSIGLNTTGVGEVDVTGAGATWDNQNSLRVGVDGTGTLRMENGGTVITGGTAFIGVGSTGEGTVVVTGAGSALQANSNFELGNGGTGNLQVQSGGTVTTAGDSVVGAAAGTEGRATVTGAGSSWSAGRFSLGFSGEGTITVDDGATLETRDALIGSQTGGTGNARITGANSRWTNNGSARIGSFGQGSLRIEDGATMNTSSFAVLGAGAAAAGTMTITGDGSTWSAGSLFIGQFGAGDLTVSDGGRLVVGSGTGAVNVGLSAGSAGVFNIGAAAGQAPAGTGTVDASAVDFGDGDSRLVFNHTDDGYVFSLDVRDDGVVDHYAGTTVFTGTLQHTGGTRLIGGTMLVNGRITGDVELSGGVLGGTGRLANITVRNGATLAPGASIGTTQADDVTFGAGSTFAVEVNSAGQSDLLQASGTVTIDPGAELSILPETPGDDGSGFNPQTQYTILTAAGGLTGLFDRVTDAFAFLDAGLNYGTTDLVLTLSRNEIPFAGVAVTPNQMATAGAIQALGFGNPLFDAILPLTQADARASYDMLSGEIHSSFAGLLVDQSIALRRAAFLRLDGTSHNSGAGPEVWGQAYGWTGERTESQNLDFQYSGGGLVVGADFAALSDWRFGILGAVGRSSAELDQAGSETDADSVSFGVYAGRRFGSVGLQFGAGYTHHDIDGTRQVRAGTLSETVRSDYTAETLQVYGELSNRFDTSVAAIEPFAELAHVIHDTDAFTEEGGSSALTVAPESLETSYATLGLRAENHTLIEGVTAFGSVAWQRAFGDTVPEATASFAAGDDFGVSGMPIAEDSAVIDAGARYDLGGGAHLSLAYNGAFGSGLSNHGVTARFEMRF